MAKLTIGQRDEVLIRLDEKSNNIWRSIEKIESHQEAVNGHIADLIECTSKNTGWRKVSTSLWVGLILAFIAFLCTK